MGDSDSRASCSARNARDGSTKTMYMVGGESRKTFSNSLGMARDVGSNEFGICIAWESTS